jgi:hypothetical protein
MNNNKTAVANFTPVLKTCVVGTPGAGNWRTFAGVWGRKTSAGTKTETSKITLPLDAQNINLTAATGFVDDDKPDIKINGQPFFTNPGQGIGKFAIQKALPLNKGENTVTLKAYSSITYWSLAFAITGTYEASECTHVIQFCEYVPKPKDTCADVKNYQGGWL